MTGYAPLFQNSGLDLGNIGLDRRHVGFQNRHIRLPNRHIRLQARHITFQAKHIDFQRFDIAADRCRPLDGNANKGNRRPDPCQIMQHIHQAHLPRFRNQGTSMGANWRNVNEACKLAFINQ